MAKRVTKNSLSTLKNKNRGKVLDFIRHNDGVSMADIARVSGLSIMTVHNIVEHYLKTGMIKPADARDDGAGKRKRSRLFVFDPDFRYIFSARVAERKIISSLANLGGDVTVSHSETIAPNTPLDAVLDTLSDNFSALIKRRKAAPDDCLGAVVGWPCIIDNPGGVCVVAPHFPSWGRNIPLTPLLRERFPAGVHIAVDNAMRYRAYCEMKHMDVECRRFFLVGIEAENVVGALVLDGRVERGDSGLAGEVGHMPVDPHDRRPCVCGSTGCLELMISPKGLEEKAAALRKKYPGSAVFTAQGTRERPRFIDIVAASNAGDDLARHLIDGAATHFSTAFKSIILSCDPGLIVIQGAYAQAGEYFLSQLRAKISEMALFSIDHETRIRYSTLDDDSCLVGGALLLADECLSD